jgi:hypothetical protein
VALQPGTSTSKDIDAYLPICNVDPQADNERDNSREKQLKEIDLLIGYALTKQHWTGETDA